MRLATPNDMQNMSPTFVHAVVALQTKLYRAYVGIAGGAGGYAALEKAGSCVVTPSLSAARLMLCQAYRPFRGSSHDSF